MKHQINVTVIEKYLKTHKLSKRKFCRLCKISPSTLNKILNGDYHFYISNLWKIANFMGVPFAEMFTA